VVPPQFTAFAAS